MADIGEKNYLMSGVAQESTSNEIKNLIQNIKPGDAKETTLLEVNNELNNLKTIISNLNNNTSLEKTIINMVGECYEFDTPGTYTITIPDCVDNIKITACGAGGGGGGGSAKIQNSGINWGSNASAGGSTIISNIITLQGGAGGHAYAEGAFESATGFAGGEGGGDGGYRSVYYSATTGEMDPKFNGNDGIIGKGGNGSRMLYYGIAGGGGGSLGPGGDGGSKFPSGNGNPGVKGGGGGGAQGYGTNSSYYGIGGSGGGGGAAVADMPVIMTNLNRTITITIGAGGIGGSNNTTGVTGYTGCGGNGGNGYAKIGWGVAYYARTN